MESHHFQDFLEKLKSSVSDFSLLSANEIHREFVIESLAEHLSEISQILFFLMGAMTIVELVDAHHGFKFITDRITTKNAKTLLWIVCGVTFGLSAILDNLTTTIVMISILRKLIKEHPVRLYYVGMMIIAANAGGAWSPIGDVTTTMLWIGGQVTTVNIITTLLAPSLICMLVPLIIGTVGLKGELKKVTLDIRAAEKKAGKSA